MMNNTDKIILHDLSYCPTLNLEYSNNQEFDFSAELLLKLIEYFMNKNLYIGLKKSGNNIHFYFDIKFFTQR